MSDKSEVFPIWNVGKEEQTLTSKKKKTTKEMSQKIQIAIKGLRRSETKQLKSPDLHFKKLNNSSWYLTIEPRIKQNDSKHLYFGLFLHLKSNKFELFGGHIVKFVVSLKDTKRGKKWSKSSRELYFNGECGWGWKYFAKIDEIFESSQRSLDLNLILSITWITPFKGEENHNSGDSSDKLDEFSFIHDFLNDKEYCDIRFVIGDSHLSVHSKLLASKSLVFEKLFAKQKEISIPITEMDSNVFYELILFLYRGYSLNVVTHCKKLLIAANYYQIPKLKLICDNLCFRNLSPEKAIDALIFSDKYQSHNSRIRSLCFIALHLYQIKSSSAENWLRFETENKVLFREVLEIADMICECLQH